MGRVWAEEGGKGGRKGERGKEKKAEISCLPDGDHGTVKKACELGMVVIPLTMSVWCPVWCLS